jgi:hypothetical protein
VAVGVVLGRSVLSDVDDRRQRAGGRDADLPRCALRVGMSVGRSSGSSSAEDQAGRAAVEPSLLDRAP